MKLTRKQLSEIIAEETSRVLELDEGWRDWIKKGFDNLRSPMTKPPPEEAGEIEISKPVAPDEIPIPPHVKNIYGSPTYKKLMRSLADIMLTFVPRFIPKRETAEKIVKDVHHYMGNGKFTKLVLKENVHILPISKILEDNGILGLRANGIKNALQDWTKQFPDEVESAIDKKIKTKSDEFEQFKEELKKTKTLKDLIRTIIAMQKSPVLSKEEVRELTALAEKQKEEIYFNLELQRIRNAEAGIEEPEEEEELEDEEEYNELDILDADFDGDLEAGEVVPTTSTGVNKEKPAQAPVEEPPKKKQRSRKKPAEEKPAQAPVEEPPKKKQRSRRKPAEEKPEPPKVPKKTTKKPTLQEIIAEEIANVLREFS